MVSKYRVLQKGKRYYPQQLKSFLWFESWKGFSYDEYCAEFNIRGGHREEAFYLTLEEATEFLRSRVQGIIHDVEV